MKPSIFIASTALLLAEASSAAVITNGDFELTSVTNPNFPGWGEFSTDTLTATRDTAAIISTSTISGTSSVELVSGATGGAIRQATTGAPAQYDMTLNFASLLPNAGAPVGSRYFSLQMKHGAETSTAQINVRVIETGRVQCFDGAGWQNIGTLTANFTADTGTVGAWDGESLVTNSLQIVADYTVAPTYSITLNGTTVSGLSYFQGGAPTPGVSGLNAISFNGGAASKNFLVDDLVVVPEPSATLLGGLAGSLALLRRRRSC